MHAETRSEPILAHHLSAASDRARSARLRRLDDRLVDRAVPAVLGLGSGAQHPA